MLCLNSAFAPMRCKICESTFTSKISGRLSTTHGSSLKSAAGRMATAAFFAPLTVTVPFNGFPPFMINVGSKYNSSRFWRMLFPGPWSYGKRPQSISALRLCAHIINASFGFDNALPAPPCRKREKTIQYCTAKRRDRHACFEVYLPQMQPYL